MQGLPGMQAQSLAQGVHLHFTGGVHQVRALRVPQVARWLWIGLARDMQGVHGVRRGGV